jgi:hypothetical protein
VNPEHLFLGYDQDNANDKVIKNRQSKGESHGMHVLNQSQVLEIKDMLNHGYTGYQIASMFSVHPQTIYSIKNKDNWSWLDD